MLFVVVLRLLPLGSGTVLVVVVESRSWWRRCPVREAADHAGRGGGERGEEALVAVFVVRVFLPDAVFGRDGRRTGRRGCIEVVREVVGGSRNRDGGGEEGVDGEGGRRWVVEIEERGRKTGEEDAAAFRVVVLGCFIQLRFEALDGGRVIHRLATEPDVILRPENRRLERNRRRGESTAQWRSRRRDAVPRRRRTCRRVGEVGYRV